MAADGSVVFSISADDKEAQAKLNQLRRDIEKTAKSLNENTAKRNGLVEQLHEAQAEAAKTLNIISELQSQKAENDRALRLGNIDAEEYAARKQSQAEINYQLAEQNKKYEKQLATVKKLSAQEEALSDKISNQTDSIGEMETQAGQIENAFARSGSSALPQLQSAIDGASKSIKKGFRNILKWGFGIRSAFILMRRLRSAIKEGITTFAQYDSETKANIDSLKSSLSSLKLAWGAAFAPILNAVAPMLQRLIDLLITAANYVQMFFAALRGGTSYKKIIKNNDNLAKSYGGAGGAAEEAKKSVMGFDELNKLDDQSSGGGGGGGGGDAGLQNMDEEFIPQKVLDRVQWLKDHFQDILGIAAGIAALLLAWKISSKLGIPFLKSLRLILGILLAVIGAIKFIQGYIDAWKNGINWDNLETMLGGMLLIVVGLGIAFGTTGAAIGLLVTGVALLVLAIKEWIQTGQLSTEAFIALEAGILAVGLAIALLTGSWIPILIAAVVALVMLIIQYWDEIKEFAINVWNAIKDAIVNAWNAVKEWTINTWNNIKQAISNVWDNIKTAIVNAINAVVTKIQDFKDKVSQTVDKIVEKITNLKNKFVEKFNAIRDKAQEIIDKVKEFFNFHWQLPHINLPHLTVEWVPAGDLGRFFGFSAIPNLGVQWYARGGVVDGATLFGAGEAGKEAVIPLERHTEWIDMVVDGLLDSLSRRDAVSRIGLPALANGQIVPPRALANGGSMFSDGDIDRLVNGIVSAIQTGGGFESVTKLYLDGRQIAENVTKHQREMSRGMG